MNESDYLEDEIIDLKRANGTLVNENRGLRSELCDMKILTDLLNDKLAKLEDLKGGNDILVGENCRLASELLDTKTQNNRLNAKLADVHRTLKHELYDMKTRNDLLNDKLAKLEERHRLVCAQLDRDDNKVYRYQSALDILLERLINMQVEPLADEDGAW